MTEEKRFIETLEISGGNTETPEILGKKQSSQLLNWCFTWNNYQENDIEILETYFRHFCFKFCFQEETGENGTRHLQGVMSLKKRARWNEFGLPKCIHWEGCKHVTKSYEYCSKTETRTGKIFAFNYVIPKELKLLKPENFNQWQKDILDIFRNEPDDRKVYWFWSKNGGVGKSAFAKYLVAKENCLFFEEGKKADIMHLIFTCDASRLDKIVIDVPRANGNSISYKSVESIKNGLIYSSKYEGGYKLFNPPHLIVFANMPPQEDQLSADRWVIRNID